VRSIHRADGIVPWACRCKKHWIEPPELVANGCEAPWSTSNRNGSREARLRLFETARMSPQQKTGKYGCRGKLVLGELNK